MHTSWFIFLPVSELRDSQECWHELFFQGQNYLSSWIMISLPGLKMPFYFGMFNLVFFKVGSVYQRKDASWVAFLEKVSFC